MIAATRTAPTEAHMNRLCLRITSAFMLLVATALATADDTLTWLDDYDAALAKARETGMPLLAEFRCAP